MFAFTSSAHAGIEPFDVYTRFAAPIESFDKTFDARRGEGIAVNYTFDTYRCVGGTSQYRSCQWIGTVTADSTGSTITNVVYRDAPPAGVAPGLSIEAQWDSRDPRSAYEIGASRAWLGILTSGAVDGFGAILFLLLSIGWWRKVIRSHSAQPPTDTEVTEHRALENHPTA